VELLLVRHGQTDYNAEKRFQGRIDVPLNATGKAQASAMRMALRDQLPDIARIYSSPLCRATETARLIAPNISMIRLDCRLMEISLGDFDGCLEADIETEIGPKNYRAWRDSNFVQAAPGGESLEQAMQRARAFLQRLTDCAGGQRIVVVSHQGMLMALKAVISGESTPEALIRYRQKNDQIDVWDNERAQLLRRIDASQFAG